MSDKEHRVEYRVVRQKKDGDDEAYAHTVDLEVTGDNLGEIRKKLSYDWSQTANHI